VTTQGNSESAKLKDLLAAVAQLVGRGCWSVSFDPDDVTGSQLIVDLDPPVRRPRPVTNPTLTAQEQEFMGEYALMAFGLWIWADAAGDRSWTSVSEDEVHALIGKIVSAASFDSETYRLTVAFDGVVSVVFIPEPLHEASPQSSYALFANDQSFGVTRDHRVEIELRHIG
jgi:hypothetical protein